MLPASEGRQRLLQPTSRALLHAQAAASAQGAGVFGVRIWTHADVDRLIGLRAQGMENKMIARTLGRSHQSIVQRLRRLNARRWDDWADLLARLSWVCDDPVARMKSERWRGDLAKWRGLGRHNDRVA